MTAKLIERSPLKYKIIRAISSLLPSTIVNNRVLSEKRMGVLLEILYDTNNVTAEVADKAKGQFVKLCSRGQEELRDLFTDVIRNNGRLDTFYYDILGNDNDCTELWTVVRLVLILSHGNASVESGFSVNSAILVENMHEESIIAQRVVYDTIQATGGVLSADINKSLLMSVRASRSRYEEALRKKREASAVETKKREEKKRAADQIKMLKAKKAKLTAAVAVDVKAIESHIAELEKL